MRGFIIFLLGFSCVMYVVGIISINTTGRVNPAAWTLGVLSMGFAFGLIFDRQRKRGR